MKARKSNKRQRRFSRRPFRRGRFLAPPPVNIDPWFRVTLSFEDKASGNTEAMTVQALFDALSLQIKAVMSGVYYVLRLHSVRAWNISGGSLFLQPCQLIEKHSVDSVTLPLRSLEAYSGRARWAFAQFRWPKVQASMEQDNNSNQAVVLMRKAPKNDVLVIHISISFKMTTPSSFLSSVPVREPVSIVSGLSSVSTSFEKLDVDEEPPESLPLRRSVRVARRLR